ncbi:MAG TPA: PqiC family protein [Kofleriaceae bacterium]|jgi:hypothetical protein
MFRLVVLAALVAGCRSPGSHYYTLVAAPSEAPSPATNEIQIDVLPVDVPADVDRAEIVVRTGTGEVTPVDTRSWIAPLPREIRRAFSDDLTRLLGARDIAGLAAAAGVPTFRVKLAVQRFDSQLGQRAVIEAVSTVHDISSEAPILVCSHRATETAAAGYAGLAEAHQRALAAIAKQVAESVRSIRAGSPACAAP